MFTPDEFYTRTNVLDTNYDVLYTEWSKNLDQIRSQAQTIRMLQSAVEELELTLITRDFEIARLQALLDNDLPPTPIQRIPLIGISGSVEKIPGACERWFDSGVGFTKVAPRRDKTSCPRIHASWKIFGNPAPTDAQIISAFKNLYDGDKVEVEHETDVKYRKDVKAGQPYAEANLITRLTLKSQFYDQVTRLRESGLIPAVDVVNTLSHWSFATNGPKDAVKYICAANVLGVDLDGDDAEVNGYLDYGDPVTLGVILAFAETHYGGRWTVPEHGWNNTIIGERIPHFKQTIPAIAFFGPEEIQIFDAQGWSPLLTMGELAELAVFVQQYNM